MRLFIAVDLDERARSFAAEAGAAVDERLRRSGSALRVAWVPAENMHSTIRFLGHANEVLATRLIDEFQMPLTAPRFTAAIGGLGAFPARGTPRVVWIGVLEGGGGFQRVYEEIGRRIGPLGVLPEDRPYSPHVTLGRVRDASRAAADRLRRAVREGMSGSARWHVGHVTLYESRLSSHGPRYQSHATAPLATP